VPPPPPPSRVPYPTLFRSLMILATAIAEASYIDTADTPPAVTTSRASERGTDSPPPPPPPPPADRPWIEVLEVAADPELTQEAADMYFEAFTDGCKSDFVEKIGRASCRERV